MGNIYDTANQLEKDIRELPMFLELKAAVEAMKADEEAARLFKEFQETQMTLQQKQMQGEEITEEDATNMQLVVEKIQTSDLIMALMDKEQALSTYINDLNSIIMKPIQELYEN
ncbi:YlbF family regulator [Vagococcus humatus]|uniref:UPF0342 protein C7P63_04550 n=1 Tax=Vagococcus humatus TaxID=1889241 RepID=A0A3S0A6Y9_9ENTE|nr:YlbF family regulator [Vagococcus humatus]RST90348.1 hypothetical protein C7P63_04550 [Vagococcus humatus]